ncbi:hypothetical protein [Wukongibacter sp. M2B1]|uniref:hypothetical protein n=1 Tax=Wukongibacter sp. M2B1 TaxID=3088895 RepID=UPI003D78B65E
MKNKKKELALKLGFWSSVYLIILCLLYGFGLISVITNYGIPKWDGLSSYIDFSKHSSFCAYKICMVTSMLAAPVFTVLACSIHEMAEEHNKLLSFISVCFSIAFASIVSIVYFMQFTMIPSSIMNGNFEGLNQLILLNQNSFAALLAVLGYNFFLGLSTLFLAFVFKETSINIWIKGSFLLTGIFCMIALLAYILNQVELAVYSAGIYNTSLIFASALLGIKYYKILNHFDLVT